MLEIAFTAQVIRKNDFGAQRGELVYITKNLSLLPIRSNLPQPIQISSQNKISAVNRIRPHIQHKSAFYTNKSSKFTPVIRRRRYYLSCFKHDLLYLLLCSTRSLLFREMVSPQHTVIQCQIPEQNKAIRSG